MTESSCFSTAASYRARTKALAMDAPGRTDLPPHGLGAAGDQGVAKCLSIIAYELETTMGLCGVWNVGDIGRHNLMGQSGCST